MIVRADHDQCFYVKISTETLRDPRLSLRAKGLLATLLTYPDDWQANIKHLVNICQEGETAIRTALNELKDLGYLAVKKLRNKLNQFAGTAQTIYETINDKVVKMKPKQNDPHFPPQSNAVRERQEQKAWEDSLGNGPWGSPEEKEQFRKELEAWARSRNYNNPGGYAHTIVKNMVNGEGCTRYDEWKEGIPLGSSDTREWEMVVEGKTVTNPSFEAWLKQGLAAKDLSEVQIAQQAANILNNPAKAEKLWRDYKFRLVNDNQEKERLSEIGVQGFTPPTYLSAAQQEEPTYQEALEAASNLVQFPTQRTQLPAQQQEGLPQQHESWADTIYELIESSKGTPFKFWRGGITRAIAEQGDKTGEIEEIILNEFSEKEQKAIFDLLLESPKTREWAQTHYPEHLPIEF